MDKALAIIVILYSSIGWCQTNCGDTTIENIGSTTGASTQFGYTNCTVPASGVTGAVTSACIYNTASLTGTTAVQLGAWTYDGAGGAPKTLACTLTTITLTNANTPGWVCGNVVGCTLSLGTSYRLGWDTSNASFANPNDYSTCTVQLYQGVYQSQSYGSLANFSSPNLLCTAGHGIKASEYIVLTNSAPAFKTGILPPMMGR